jgi:tetratricopeptide (TPR) repeat protein
VLLVRTVDGAERIDGSGGDGGVDVVVRRPGGDHVYEIKSFHRRLTPAQRRQVVRSLQTAVKLQRDMSAWTLVLPLDPSPAEHQWLREVLAAETTANVSWMGRTAVEAAFAERPDLARAFLPGSSERRAMELLIEHGLGDIGGGGGQGTTVAYQLPPVPDFVGRTRELQVLRDILGAESPATEHVVVSAVAGMPGIGKTALAVKAAQDAVDSGWFAGGALFLDLRGYDRDPVSPARALDSLLRGLGVPSPKIPPETEDRIGLYRSVLAGSKDAVLVVLDNASSAEQVRPLLPGDRRHRVLVTSRHSLPQLGARLLDLAVLTADEAVGLLDADLRAADPSDNRIAADSSSSRKMSSHCGYLPLALRIAAALLAMDPTKPVSELEAELAEARTRLDHLDDGERAVRAAFDLSYHRLPPEQARLFRLLGVYPGPDVSVTAVAAMADREEAAVRRMLAELSRAHLVEAASIRNRWQMHDLIRIYAEQVPSHHSQVDERRYARDRLCDYILKVADAADDHLTALPGAPKPAEFADRAEALEWFDTERATLVAVTYMAAEHGRDDIAHHLPARLVEYFSLRRYLDDWFATATTSKQAAIRLHDPDLVATGLINYGNVLREVGRPADAVDACRSAVVLIRSTGSRRGEAAALTNLGAALRHMGQVDEAISVGVQAREVFRRLGDPRGEARALNNIGNTLYQAGRFEEAREIHREHLDLCRLTGDHVGEAMALVGLGNSYEHDQDLHLSLGSYEAAITAYREAGMSSLPSSLLNNLGNVLRQLGRFDEAAARHREDLQICREAQDLSGQGRAHVGIALALAGLDMPATALGECHQAVECAQGAGRLDIELMAQYALSGILRLQGRWPERIASLRRIADLSRPTGQPDAQALILLDLGQVLEANERFKDAVQAFTDAIDLFRAAGHRQLEGIALSARGDAFFAMNRKQQSERDQVKALAIARKVDDRCTEGRALVGLGRLALLANRPRDAVPILRQAVDATRQSDDTRHAFAALCHLSAALMETGRGDESFPLMDEAIELCPNVDPLDVLDFSTNGKVRSFETFLSRSMAPEGAKGSETGTPPARHQRKKHGRRRRRR